MWFFLAKNFTVLNWKFSRARLNHREWCQERRDVKEKNQARRIWQMTGVHYFGRVLISLFENRSFSYSTSFSISLQKYQNCTRNGRINLDINHEWMSQQSQNEENNREEIRDQTTCDAYLYSLDTAFCRVSEWSQPPKESNQCHFNERIRWELSKLQVLQWKSVTKNLFDWFGNSSLLNMVGQRGTLTLHHDAEHGNLI